MISSVFCPIIGWFHTSPNPISEAEDAEIVGFESLDLSLEIGFPLSTNCCTERKKRSIKETKTVKICNLQVIVMLGCSLV